MKMIESLSGESASHHSYVNKVRKEQGWSAGFGIVKESLSKESGIFYCGTGVVENLFIWTAG